MESLTDDALANICSMVARLDCKTATETVPLVCRRWKRVQKTVCGNVFLNMNEIGCSFKVALQRFKSVIGVTCRRDIKDSNLVTLIAENCKSLAHLTLCGLLQVKDAGVMRLPRIASRLLHLTLICASK